MTTSLLDVTFLLFWVFWQLHFFSDKEVCNLKNLSKAIAKPTYVITCNTGFPLGLENLEKWEGIFQSGKSQGILNRLEKSGKITQNTGKLREF